ncbi:Krueppel-like factor 14 [Cephus cinctus]|uniref:Krueppel-like factor 14 n=1 Tax=Cephus cinctus TaxID=211228 RepID=A0AAJ7BGA7_CEPCN|nr:Krueppel-like factor 14 [Cephus cinctus]
MHFFRPWNDANGERPLSPEVTKPGTRSLSEMTERSIREKVKCEPKEEESVHASTVPIENVKNVVEQNLLPEDRISESPGTSSPSSRTSEDLTERNNLSMLRNFVYNTRPDNVATSSSSSSSSTSSSPSVFSYPSASPRAESSQSTSYMPPYQLPVYPTEYPANLANGIVPMAGSMEFPTASKFAEASAGFAAACASSMELPTFPPQPMYYGMPNFNLPQPSYATMESAVNYINQQEAVAKQIKKLRPKKFRCEYCNVAFSNNGQLRGHTRIHTGERPFTCNIDSCGKSFTRNEELTRHKRIHTGLRPHACILCGKRFGRKDHLKKHARTHENRMPYYLPAPNGSGTFAFGHPLTAGPLMQPYLFSL